MSQPTKTPGAAAMLAALLIVASACQKTEGPVEQAGRKVDQATEKAGQEIEKAGSKLQDAAQSDKK